MGYPMRATRIWSLSRLLNGALPPQPETCGQTQYDRNCFHGAPYTAEEQAGGTPMPRPAKGLLREGKTAA